MNLLGRAASWLKLTASWCVNFITKLLLFMLRAYQLLAPPSWRCRCRFMPSCSDYCMESLRRHGALRGVWLGFRRLLRCHPLGGSGYDAPP